VTDGLALFGGPKTAADPFPAWPRLSEKAQAEVAATLASGRLVQSAGTRVAAFEAAFAAWVGAPHAVAVASGTAALHAALAAVGVGPGDEVIVPSHTFVATPLAVLHAGALPVFCDVGDDQTLDPRAIDGLVTPRTRAVLAVHLYGVTCDMGRIVERARERGIFVLEDCAQALGAEWKGRRAGTLGQAGCFSFSQVKHLTTAGEGGMVTTADAGIASRVRSIADLGRERSGDASVLPHVRMGWNYHLTEVQAAVGIAELERLEEWNLGRRKGFARAYDHAFAQLRGVRALPLNTDERRNAYWIYPLQLDLERLTCGVERVREALAAEGIPLPPAASRESCDEPVFAGAPGDGAAGADAAPPRCPNAELLRARTLGLYLHPTWERTHVDLVAAAVKKVLRAFRR
jgi:dTDP-4-amino-4,6-dideoxygalactose transaminase